MELSVFTDIRQFFNFKTHNRGIIYEFNDNYPIERWMRNEIDADHITKDDIEDFRDVIAFNIQHMGKYPEHELYDQFFSEHVVHQLDSYQHYLDILNEFDDILMDSRWEIEGNYMVYVSAKSY